MKLNIDEIIIFLPPPGNDLEKALAATVYEGHEPSMTLPRSFWFCLEHKKSPGNEVFINFYHFKLPNFAKENGKLFQVKFPTELETYFAHEIVCFTNDRNNWKIIWQNSKEEDKMRISLEASRQALLDPANGRDFFYRKSVYGWIIRTESSKTCRSMIFLNSYCDSKRK